MKRTPQCHQHHVLYDKYQGQDSEISGLLGECGLKMIDAIGKGRFAQRMLSYIDGIAPPGYIARAIEFVSDRV